MNAKLKAVENSTSIVSEQGSHQSATLEHMFEQTLLIRDMSHLDPQARAYIAAQKALIIKKNLA